MPCAITAARGLTCKDTAGGVKAVYLANFDPTFHDGLTFTSGVATGTTSNLALFRYDVRPSTTGTNTEISNEAAGSAAYTSTLSVVLHGLSGADNTLVETIVAGRFFAFVMDSNDKVWGLGLRNGCTADGGTMSIGTARTDLYGYTLNIVATESFLPVAIVASASPTALDWPFDGLAGTGTVTVTNPA
jgi:hypothetical protein